MCTRTTLNSITNSVKEAALGLFSDKLKSVILYGSYARGDYDDESDIDIFLLVDLPHGDFSKYRREISKVTGKLSMEADDCVTISTTIKSLDIYSKYKDSLPFYKNVDSEGIVIYEN